MDVLLITGNWGLILALVPLAIPLVIWLGYVVLMLVGMFGATRHRSLAMVVVPVMGAIFLLPASLVMLGLAYYLGVWWVSWLVVGWLAYEMLHPVHHHEVSSA